MAGTTSVYGLRYQTLGDSPDGASLGEDLADDVETELIRIDASVAAINGLSAVSGSNSTTEGPYSSNTFTAGTAVCSAVFVAPPSGSVLVHLKAYFQSAINDKVAIVGVEVRTGATIGSGSVQTAASTFEGLVLGGTVTSGVPLRLSSSTPRLITGLTPGNSYHVRVMHSTETGGSITLFFRQAIVVPML